MAPSSRSAKTPKDSRLVVPSFLHPYRTRPTHGVIRGEDRRRSGRPGGLVVQPTNRNYVEKSSRLGEIEPSSLPLICLAYSDYHFFEELIVLLKFLSESWSLEADGRHLRSGVAQLDVHTLQRQVWFPRLGGRCGQSQSSNLSTEVGQCQLFVFISDRSCLRVFFGLDCKQVLVMLILLSERPDRVLVVLVIDTG